MASQSIVPIRATHPRAWARVAIIGLALIFMLPFHLLVRRFTYFSPFSRLWLRFSAWAAGVTIRVEGPRRLRNVLYIANHVSWLDILVLSGRTGCAFVARGDMAPWPVIGWMATLNNSVYVARDNKLDVGAQKDALAATNLAPTNEKESAILISFSTFGRLISVRLNIVICCSTLGCTASPDINGLRMDWVSTKIRAEASYLSGTEKTTTAPTMATTHATPIPAQRCFHIPLRTEITWPSSSSISSRRFIQAIC